MKISIGTIWLILAALMTAPLPPAQTGAQTEDGHAYAQLQTAELEVKDFEFPTLGGEKIRLSEAARGQRLVLVHYFAAWCHNSNYDVETINELYRKYQDQGLAVIGVCEYSTRGELKKFIGKHKPAYPICFEGEGRKSDRTRTTHHYYRSKIADNRVWGTPLNLLFGLEDMRNEGEIVAGRARVAAGELIKTEVEELILAKLSQK
jgi:peroxiredoxin